MGPEEGEGLRRLEEGELRRGGTRRGRSLAERHPALRHQRRAGKQTTSYRRLGVAKVGVRPEGPAGRAFRAVGFSANTSTHYL
jgi:hypothetical protein